VAGVSHTKRNLLAIDDVALSHGLSEVQEARFPRAELGAESTGFVHLRIKPGRREAFAHRHREAEEILVVLSGAGRIELDSEAIELEPLDAVRIGPGVTRRLQAGEGGLEVLVFGPHVEGDAEIVEGAAGSG
jgi:mannose-6-phosphate isomerase-like protein (cupin superfamily)